MNNMRMTRNSVVLFNGLTNRDEYDPDNDIHGNDPFRIEERLPRSDPLLRKGRVGGHATKSAVSGCVSGSFSVCGAVDGRHGAHGWCGGERLRLECHYLSVGTEVVTSLVVSDEQEASQELRLVREDQCCLMC